MSIVVKPLQVHHADALQRFLSDFDAANETAIPAYFPSRDWTHARIVDSLAAWGRGEVPEPWVPCSTFFAFDEDAIVGVVNIRHHLDERLAVFGGHVGYSTAPSARGRGVAKAMLAYAMDFCRDLTLSELTLTCAPDNIGSCRVIEACGGVERDRYHYDTQERDVVRFRLPL